MGVSAHRERGRTFVEAIAYATEIAVARKSDAAAQVPAEDGSGPAAREFALAMTHLEEAQMRFTRGMAKVQSKYAPVDLERDQ